MRLPLFILAAAGLALSTAAQEVGRFQLVAAAITDDAGQRREGLYRIDTVTGEVDELVYTGGPIQLRDGRTIKFELKGWNAQNRTIQEALEIYETAKQTSSANAPSTPGPGGLLDDIRRDIRSTPK